MKMRSVFLSAAICTVCFGGMADGWNWVMRVGGTPAEKTWPGLAVSDDMSSIYGAGFEQYLFVSWDSGFTWNPRAPGGDWENIACSADGKVVLACSFPGGLYLSTDSAANMAQVSIGGEYWQSTAVSSDGSSLLMASEYRGSVWFSTDNGANWNESSLGSGNDFYWNSVGCSSDGMVAMAIDGGTGKVFLSKDKCATWNNVLTMPIPTSSMIKGTVSRDGKTLIVVSPSTGVKPQISRDGGDTWSESAPAGTGSIGLFKAAMSADVSVILLTGGAENAGYLWMSKDKGVSWTALKLPDGIDGTPSAAVSGNGARFILGARQLYVSDDQGSSWKMFDNTGSYWYSSAMSASGSTIFSTGAGMGIMCSKNGGNTWTDLGGPTGVGYEAVGCSPDAGILAVGSSQDGNLYISKDGGGNWNVAGDLSPSPWASIAISDGGKLISACAGSSSGFVAVSDDGGNSWNLFNDQVFWWNSAVAADGSLALACGASGMLVGTRDGGKNWIDMTPPDLVAKLSAVACSADGTRIYVSSYPGLIYASDDGGVTWSPLASPSLEWVSLSCSANGQTIMGTVAFDYVYISSDFGASWTKLDPAGTNTLWNTCLLSSDGDSAFLSVFGGNLYTGTDVNTGKYTLTISSYPSSGGQTQPTGNQLVDPGVEIPISATAADGFSFAGWISGFNSRIADPASASTTVACSGDSYVTAVFTKATVGVGGFSLSYDSLHPSKEKVVVSNAGFPAMPTEFNPSLDVATIQIGCSVIRCTPRSGAWSTTSNGYVFKSNKLQPFKLKLVLDTKRKAWSLNSTGYPLSDPVELGGSLISIRLGDCYYASYQQADCRSSWGYGGESGNPNGFVTKTYKGSIGLQALSGRLSLSGSFPWLPEGFGSVALKVNSLALNVAESDFKTKGVSKVFNGQTPVGKTFLVFDLSKNLWSLKLSKADLAGAVSPFGVADISLTIGPNDTATESIKTMQKTKLTKSR